ncbi:MAG: hypothetical protein HYZ27_12335 [Deltaproteobacteria bacterium]|nr:hypothetical protein [Deltaproteobacteria bacterium]
MKALFLCALAAVAGGCASPEDDFIRGRSLDPCGQHIAACPGQFALCILNSTKYTRQRFPDASPFLFLVSAFQGDTIEVSMFFTDQNDAGLDTQIWWYELGCYDYEVYRSNGADIFEEAGTTNIFSRKAQVYDNDQGDHLIEIQSDMQAEVLITVDVHVQGGG